MRRSSSCSGSTATTSKASTTRPRCRPTSRPRWCGMGFRPPGPRTPPMPAAGPQASRDVALVRRCYPTPAVASIRDNTRSESKYSQAIRRAAAKWRAGSARIALHRRGRFVDVADREQTAAHGQVVLESRRLQDHRTSSRQEAGRAIAEPAASRSDISPLGDAEILPPYPSRTRGSSPALRPRWAIGRSTHSLRAPGDPDPRPPSRRRARRVHLPATAGSRTRVALRPWVRIRRARTRSIRNLADPRQSRTHFRSSHRKAARDRARPGSHTHANRCRTWAGGTTRNRCSFPP